jgi:hypothetical protein
LHTGGALVGSNTTDVMESSNVHLFLYATNFLTPGHWVWFPSSIFYQIFRIIKAYLLYYHVNNLKTFEYHKFKGFSDLISILPIKSTLYFKIPFHWEKLKSWKVDF